MPAIMYLPSLTPQTYSAQIEQHIPAGSMIKLYLCQPSSCPSGAAFYVAPDSHGGVISQHTCPTSINDMCEAKIYTADMQWDAIYIQWSTVAVPVPWASNLTIGYTIQYPMGYVSPPWPPPPPTPQAMSPPMTSPPPSSPSPPPPSMLSAPSHDSSYDVNWQYSILTPILATLAFAVLIVWLYRRKKASVGVQNGHASQIVMVL